MNCPYCNRELWEQQEVCDFCGKPQPLYEGPEGYEWDSEAGMYYQVQGAARFLFDPISGKYSDEPVSSGNVVEDETIYAPPEGFLFDENSGWYKQEAMIQVSRGTRYLLITWFDPVTGAYEQNKRLLEEKMGPKPPQAGRGIKKHLTAAAGMLLIALVGAVGAHTMGWLELPFLSSDSEMKTATAMEQSQERPTLREETGVDNDLLVNDEESVVHSSGDQGTESFASEREEAVSAADDADPPDETPAPPNETEAGPPAETEQNQVPEDSSAVRIITELSTSPSPVAAVSAGYDGTKTLHVAYEITQGYREYGTMFFWYGDNEETQDSVDESIEFAEDFLFRSLHYDPIVETEVLGAAQMEQEVDISVFEGFPDQLRYVYIGLITFNDRYEYVAHTVLEIDLAML